MNIIRIIDKMREKNCKVSKFRVFKKATCNCRNNKRLKSRTMQKAYRVIL